MTPQERWQASKPLRRLLQSEEAHGLEITFNPAGNVLAYCTVTASMDELSVYEHGDLDQEVCTAIKALGLSAPADGQALYWDGVTA